MPRDDLRRYAAPAAFLLAVTVAVVLVRSGMDAGRHGAVVTTSAAPVTTTQRVADATTTGTRTTGTKPPAKQYWTVKAGDTFGVISSKTGVPVATIEQLNPNASSTSLFIGEKIRVK